MNGMNGDLVIGKLPISSQICKNGSLSLCDIFHFCKLACLGLFMQDTHAVRTALFSPQPLNTAQLKKLDRLAKFAYFNRQGRAFAQMLSGKGHA